MSTHYARVRRARNYLRHLAATRRVTREDVKNAALITITCTNPADCYGWIECRENHDGYDPEDESQDVEIHGVLHCYDSTLGWMVPYEECMTVASAPDQDFDGVDRSRDGTYLLGIEWDYEESWVTVKERVSDDPDART